MLFEFFRQLWYIIRMRPKVDCKLSSLPRGSRKFTRPASQSAEKGWNISYIRKFARSIRRARCSSGVRFPSPRALIFVKVPQDATNDARAYIAE